MKKILIAIDFSESCINAVNYVVEMIKGTTILIDMVHVYSLPFTMLNSSSDIKNNVIAKHESLIREKLSDQMLLVPDENRGSIQSSSGENPSSYIIDVAQQLEVELIVMAMRQKYTLIDRFLGTVTANTISNTTIPVLAIPNGSLYSKSENILFPTEAPYSSILTDTMAKRLNRLFEFCDLYRDTNIYMIHVNNGQCIDIEYQHKPIADLKFIVSCASTVEEGILKVVEKQSISLLAIEKKSRKFWERLYHSSVTRKLLFQARLPILVFTE